MKRFLHTVAVVAALGAVLVVPLAGANPGTEVTLTVDTPVIGQPGTFTADGVVCPAGVTGDVASVSGGGPITIYHADKTFVCEDGSGTFTIALVALRFDGVPGTTGLWKVKSGTGDYASLKGSGRLVGTDQPGGGIVDVFTGRLSP